MRDAFSMQKRLILLLFALIVILLCVTSGLADKADGDMGTFCPAMSTYLYNSSLKDFVGLNNSSMGTLIEVSSDGLKDGNIVYSDADYNVYFIFGGTTSEYEMGTSAFIYCSLKDSNPLKNIPMIIWASEIQKQYYGDIEEASSGFYKWVNETKKDGDTFSTPYFDALYKQVLNDKCSLLLTKR